MKKLKEIMLIDDSRGTNSLNKRLLEEMGIVENISIALNGQLALDYLTTRNEKGDYPSPDIIFLDIRMPVMDGYQFLDKYHELAKEMQSNQIIVMLTTSINELDIKRATNYESVKAYQFKPLKKEHINELLEKLPLDL